MSEKQAAVWSRIRFAASVAAGWSDILRDTQDTIDEFVEHLRNSRGQRDALQKQKQVYFTEMNKCWGHFNTFQMLKNQDPPDPFWADQQELLDSQLDKYRDECLKHSAKLEKCTNAIAEKEKEIAHWKECRDREIAREKSLTDKRRKAKEELKSLLHASTFTDVINITTLDDLAAIRHVTIMKLTLPLKISLGPNVMNFTHLADEMGFHGIKIGPVYQWNGSTWQRKIF